MGVEITVVDDSDHVGWAASATRVGEVYMTDVDSMVHNIGTKLFSMRPYTRVCNPSSPVQAPKMSRLNILDHGNANGFQIGSDWITVGTLPHYQATLHGLRSYFEPHGFVHLQHCEIGQQEVLLKKLAKVFNASVYAGTGAHNPVYRFNFGDYVRADPDGSFHKDVDRP